MSVSQDRVDAALASWREVAASPSSSSSTSTPPPELLAAPGSFSSDPELDRRLREKRARIEMEATNRSQLERLARDSTGKICRPWDTSDFMDRLDTFRASTWFAKQGSAISSDECARHGWVNVGWDELACPLCKVRVKLPSKEELHFNDDDVAFEAIVEAQASIVGPRLATAHRNVCPWYNNPFMTVDVRLPEMLESNKKTPEEVLVKVQRVLDRVLGN